VIAVLVERVGIRISKGIHLRGCDVAVTLTAVVVVVVVVVVT
jgi:hypothetical protein